MSESPSPVRKIWKHRQRQQEPAHAGTHSPSIPSACYAVPEFLDSANRNQKVVAAPAVFEQQRTIPELERRVEQLEDQLQRRLQEVESRLGELDDMQRRLKELEANRPAQPDGEEKPEAVEETTFERLKREGSELDREDIEVAGGDPLALEQVSLEPTIWDCLLLITLRGLRGLLLSPVQICCVLLLALANALLQGLCIYGIANYMIQDPLSEHIRGALLYQRMKSGHDQENLDTQTLLTRTSMLCEGRIYDSHGMLYDDVSNYFRFIFLEFRAGEVISLLAMLFWSLTMSQEMQRIYQLGKAVCNLRRLSHDPARAHVVINEKSDGYDIVRMAAVHKFAFLLFALLPRATLGMLLLYYGLRWLAATVNVSDLILNACALEIAKGLDEALFAAVLVGLVKVECFQFEPETAAPRGRASKLIRQCVMFVTPAIFIAGMLGWAHASTLSKFVDKVESADNYLCGGDRNFLYVLHGVTGLPIFAAAPSSDVDLDTTDLQQQCLYAASTDIIRIRAGFPPQWAQATDTLRRQITGTDESCSVNGTGGPMRSACPSVGFPELDEVRDWTQGDYLHPFSDRCRDQVVHMQVLHDVCTHPDFAGDATSIFNGRAECKDMEPVCHCRQRVYLEDHGIFVCLMDDDMYAEIAQTYNVPVLWIQYIHVLCPETCNICYRWYWDEEDKEEEDDDDGSDSGGGGPNDGSGATATTAEFESQSDPDGVDGVTTSSAGFDSQTT